MPGQRTRFLADAMLGSLARKLRAFGFDVAYFRAGGDEAVLRVARAERRVILTSDRALCARATSSGVRALLIGGRTEGRRISSLIAAAGEAKIKLNRGEPLCSLCGGELKAVPRSEAARFLPQSVVSRHRLFLRCTVCAQFYWRGGHWKKLSNLQRAFGHRR